MQPTLDNRFGDFHWPPTPTKIGAEIRQLWYCEGDNTNGAWRKVTCSFGPQFHPSHAISRRKAAASLTNSRGAGAWKTMRGIRAITA